MRKIFLIFGALMIILASCKNDGSGGRRHTKPEDGPKKDVAQTPTIKPNVNVYIDNSGSMKGFVDGVSEFRDLVHQYITNDIKGNGDVSKVNTFFINNTLSPCVIPNSLNNSNNLNKKSTNIAELLKLILSKTGKDTISIFISDCIFSPSTGNSKHYLGQQQVFIQDYFTNYKNNVDNATIIIYQLETPFKNNTKVPYYIWLIGERKQLLKITNVVPQPKFNNQSVKNTFIVTSFSCVKYSINPSIGKFKKSKTDTKHTIKDLKKDSRTGKVKFAVNVDFSNLLLNDEYLLNSNNYENSSKYQLEIRPATVKGNGYTHTLNFNSDKVYKGTMIIKLKAVPCKWVEDSNDDEGIRPTEGKTYGIKYQLGGIFDAFTFYNKYYTEIKINIK